MNKGYSLENTRQGICSDWKKLENQSANLQTHFGLGGILLNHIFCSEEGFQVRTALSLFIVTSLHPTVTQTLELGQS